MRLVGWLAGFSLGAIFGACQGGEELCAHGGALLVLEGDDGAHQYRIRLRAHSALDGEAENLWVLDCDFDGGLAVCEVAESSVADDTLRLEHLADVQRPAVALRVSHNTVIVNGVCDLGPSALFLEIAKDEGAYVEVPIDLAYDEDCEDICGLYKYSEHEVMLSSV